ncbi:MAG: M1 family aminopeptidase [Myxococcota bacterium]
MQEFQNLRLDRNVECRGGLVHALPRAAAATSFAFGEHTTFAATSFDLAHSFYVTGDLHRRRTARGHRLIRRGYVPVFDPFEVLTTTEALVEVGTAMFEGPTEPRPTTVMLFTESRARPHFRGLAFPNSFALWFDPGRPISRRANLLIAHEVIHRWIGGTITVRDEEGRNAEWFDEGFAVFFARRLLHRAGRLSRDAMREEIARDLEGARRHADEDPRRPAPVGQARDHLTPAYHHGALYAEYLDRQLRDDGHTRGVLGLVRDLIGEAKPRRIRPTVVPVSELRRRLEGLLGAAGSDAFDAYAIHGDVPPL